MFNLFDIILQYYQNRLYFYHNTFDINIINITILYVLQLYYYNITIIFFYLIKMSESYNKLTYNKTMGLLPIKLNYLHNYNSNKLWHEFWYIFEFENAIIY